MNDACCCTTTENEIVVGHGWVTERGCREGQSCIVDGFGHGPGRQEVEKKANRWHRDRMDAYTYGCSRLRPVIVCQTM